MNKRMRVAAAAVVVALVGVGAYSSRSGHQDDRATSFGDGMGATVQTSGADAGSSAETEAFSPATVAPAAASLASGAASSGGPVNADEQAVADTGTAANATGAAAPLPQGLGAPKVIKTAIIELEVAEGRFDAAFSKVPSIAAIFGGWVSSSTSSQAGDDDTERQAAGSLVLRVPAEHFDAARTELLRLGELRSQQIKGDDVGAQLTDLDARLRNLASQEEAIRLLMAKTKTVGETLEVQRQLSGVREQIERLSAEQARLGDAVAMSTLTVNLAEPGAVAERGSEPSPLGEALSRAVRGAQQVLAGIIVSLGYLVPLALLLGAAWLIVRPIRGRLSST